MTTTAAAASPPAQTKRRPGRPHQINEPAAPDPDGNPRTKGEAVIHYVREVEFLDTACALAGVPTGSAKRWLLDGARAALKDPAMRSGEDETLIAFRADYLTAKAEREKQYLDTSDELIRGGRRIAKVTRTRIFTGPEDTTGLVVKQVEETTTLPPDGAQLRWRMAVANGPRYSQKLQVATSDDGLELPEEELRDVVADKVEAYLAGVADAEQAAVAATSGIPMGWFSDPGDLD